ncbi:MAG: hypothetical protein AAF600_06335 [Bacteroidota bacterium]
MMNSINTTNKIVIVVLLTVTTNLQSFSQSIDQERMNRDLRVAENILSTLLTNDNRVWHQDNVEGSYIPDYGVIFMMPVSSVIFYEGKGKVFSSDGSSLVFIEDSDDSSYDMQIDLRGNKTKITKGQNLNIKELKEKIDSNLKEQIQTFLVDYADLIGQLQPSQRIVVHAKDRENFEFHIGINSTKTSKNLSAQILKSDLVAHKQGKISREELVSRIRYTSNESKDVEKDIKLFASIFARLYEPDISSTYYVSSRNIEYDRLENLGVTFNMKFYSSSSDKGFHTIRTTGESYLTKEERNKRVNAMYPEFVQSFKDNLLDYGRTVKSLKPNEMIIFKVRLTECKGCEMPEEIEVTIKAKTLFDYDSGSLSRNEALEMIAIKKKNT